MYSELFHVEQFGIRRSAVGVRPVKGMSSQHSAFSKPDWKPENAKEPGKLFQVEQFSLSTLGNQRSASVRTARARLNGRPGQENEQSSV